MSSNFWRKLFCLHRAKITQTDPSSYHVTMFLFSGLPNPKWIILSPSQAYQFIAANLPTEYTALNEGEGYGGFFIDEYKGSQRVRKLRVPGCSKPSFEKGLLDIIKGLAAVGEPEPDPQDNWVDHYKAIIDRHTDQLNPLPHNSEF